MRGMRIALVVALVAASVAIGAGVQAHQGEDVTPSKAGPIIRNTTTMSEMRDWFGNPTARKVVRVGCIRALRARWGDDLKVYAPRVEDERIVGAIFVRSLSITSQEHGELNWHTKKGLRVGDRNRKVRRLYPKAEPIKHAGHIHYRLREGRDNGYMMAKVVDRRVTQLEVWPFEFC
ncbi:MAG: hypothetical protein ACRDJ0_05875 [Actinomycetota bacterium]